MTTKLYPLIVDRDPQDPRCLSLFTNVPGAINAEVAGRICDPEYAAALANSFNERLAHQQRSGEQK